MGVRNAILRKQRNLFSATELGKLFEQWFILQVIAFNSYHNKDWRICFYRDDRKNEVDLVLDLGHKVIAIEIKYGTSWKADYLDGLTAFADVCEKPVEQVLVYRGSDIQRRGKVDVIPYTHFLSTTIFALGR